MNDSGLTFLHTFDELRLLQDVVAKFTSVIILTDSHVHDACLPVLLEKVESLKNVEIIEVEAGEESKSIDISIQLWQTLQELNADRNTLLLNLGGGVITDLGGWIASTYKRGIAFIHIPTSLLAMCDASIGGKTGIDFNGIKNSIGTFSEPVQTFICPDFLNTLPREELISGFAEIIKISLAADSSLWNEIKDIDPATDTIPGELIHRAALLKKSITDNDFRENGQRKILNFGHTIGHAIESYFLENNSPIPHGNAVALGMIAETELSVLQGTLDKSVSENIIQYIRNIYLPQITGIPGYDKIVTYLYQDKKNSSGHIKPVLLEDFGKAKAGITAEPELIRKAYETSFGDIIL